MAEVGKDYESLEELEGLVDECSEAWWALPVETRRAFNIREDIARFYFIAGWNAAIFPNKR